MKEYSNHSDSFAQAWQEAFDGAEQAPGPQVWDNIHQSLAGGATASAMANIFDEAEVEPSTDVWDKVESALAQDEAALYKRKMRRYQYVAAAAIALLFLLGGRDLYKGSFNNSTNLADRDAQETEENPLNVSGDAAPLSLASVAPSLDKGNSIKSTGNAIILPASSEEIVPTQMVAASIERPATGTVGQNALGNQEPAIVLSDENRLPPALAFEPKMVLVSADEESQRESILLTSLARTEPVLAQHSQPMEERMIYLDPTYVKRPARRASTESKPTPDRAFASVAMNGGGFAPNYRNLLTPGAENIESFGFVAAGTQEDVEELEENMRGGGSVSTGIQVGIPVAEKWMVYTGAGIGNYQVKGESRMSFSLQEDNSNAALPVTASTYRLVRESFNNQNQPDLEDLHQVTENFQYLSVPAQVGYLAMDKKVQVWLIGGVNADVFLRNTVMSDIESHENLVVNATNPNSPYQPVVVSGVLGTDVSYQLSDHWSVSVQPTIRQAVNSIAKNGEVFSGRPSFFDLGFRLKYHVQ